MVGDGGRWDLSKMSHFLGQGCEWTRTAGLLQLRVIHQALQGFAGQCKSCIDKLVSFLRFAPCCTVLLSRWCQSGVRSSGVTRQPENEANIAIAPRKMATADQHPKARHPGDRDPGGRAPRGARHPDGGRCGHARGRPRFLQAANGVWPTDHVPPSDLPGWPG